MSSGINAQQRALLQSCVRLQVEWDVNMADHSTLRAGGAAAALVRAQTPEELRHIMLRIKEMQLPCRVLGRGSNILVGRRGYKGVLIRLQGDFAGKARMDTENRPGYPAVIRAGAGCSMAGLVSWCSGQGLAGLEFMAGIPASVGGAVWMNGGAWGYEIGERIQEIECLDAAGSFHRIAAEGLLLSYRKLELKEDDLHQMIIVSVTLTLTPDEKEHIRNRCREYLARRQGKQPLDMASAGSFFKNPPGDSAGRLIDAAGFKGLSCGQAMVSPLHANFIVNTGRATATDILDLMERVQDGVLKQFGILLEPEVQIIQD